MSVFVRSPSALIVCVRYNQSSYLRFRTTKVKDTKLTLAVIPFQILESFAIVYKGLKIEQERKLLLRNPS